MLAVYVNVVTDQEVAHGGSALLVRVSAFSMLLGLS
jgi:hypothetical protein